MQRLCGNTLKIKESLSQSRFPSSLLQKVRLHNQPMRCSKPIFYSNQLMGMVTHWIVSWKWKKKQAEKFSYFYKLVCFSGVTLHEYFGKIFPVKIKPHVQKNVYKWQNCERNNWTTEAPVWCTPKVHIYWNPSHIKYLSFHYLSENELMMHLLLYHLVSLFFLIDWSFSPQRRGYC